MSLLDTNNLEPKLSSKLLRDLYGIYENKCITPYLEQVQTYSKGYIGTITGKSSYIEVWYPNSYYAGSIWVYNGRKLNQNMIHIQVSNPNCDGGLSSYTYNDLTLEEFDLMYKAIKKEDIEFLNKLHIHKPYEFSRCR